jgi:hypothetical protein
MGITAFSIASMSSVAALAMIWAARDNMRHGRRIAEATSVAEAGFFIVCAGVAAYILATGNDPLR